MQRINWISAAAVMCAMTGAAIAQPTITSLGSGQPASVSNPTGGSYYVGGSARWTVTGGVITQSPVAGRVSADGTFVSGTIANISPQVAGNTATGVSPAFSTTPTLVSVPIAATEFGSGRWSASGGTWQSLGGLPITPSLMVYGSGSSGSSTGTFLSPNAASQNGRFIVGQGYISTYNTAAGTAISNSTFLWRPWIWDANGNAGAGSMTVLSTPFRTSSNTYRRRTGAAFAVSNDGLVIAGYQEHNSSTAAAADPDGGRPVVWRWNSGTSTYDMTFLPNGMDGSNFYTISATAGSMHINAAGTIIAGKAVDNSGNTFLAKWTWNSGTSTWSAPVSFGTNLSTPASWLPSSVTSCAIPPNLSINGMSDDGNTIIGTATYSTCGSFMAGGWIWRNSEGLIQDWYDYLAELGVAGITANYGPTGDNGDPTRGLPKLGFPVGISPDGSAIVGYQGGNQLVVGASPWILSVAGGTPCAAPSITTNPAASVNFSRCSFTGSSTTVILNAGGSGTLPISYQWYKGATALVDGPTASGSTISGATSFQMRIANPFPADTGSYTCVLTGCSGATATTAAAVVQPDPAALSPANETCATATSIGEGTFNFNPCGAYVNDGATNCSVTPEIFDVWYRYTPTFTGNARFQTCASTFDTTIQLLDGSGCNGSVLACNNDVGARGVAGIGAACSSNRAVITTYPVAVGVPIYVRIGGLSTPFANSATNGALTISQAPPAPANDLCVNATIVTGNSTTAFDLNEATDDYTYGVGGLGCSDNASDTQTASNRDVWFQLISPCGGTYTISTCGSAISNPMLHVMAVCDSGDFIKCSDNVGSGVAGCTSNQARILNLSVPGTVFIRLSQSGTGSPGNAANSGSGNLIISGTDNSCVGACCVGSTCVSVTQAACTGTFTAVGTSCNVYNVSNTTPCCFADFNHANGLTVQDIFDFLSAWFAGDARADINGGVLSVQDIFDFLSVWFAGC